MPGKTERTVITHLLLCTAAALAAIVLGALFLIAPVWQFSGPAQTYTPPERASAVSKAENDASSDGKTEGSAAQQGEDLSSAA